MSTANKHLSRIEILEARIAPAFAAILELSGLDGENGFKLSGAAAGDESGYSVSDAGDINGDGFADMLVGGLGGGYVVFGRGDRFDPNLNLSELDGSAGFKISAGGSMSAAGDVNNDGLDDFTVRNAVVFGRLSAFEAHLDLLTLNGSNGFRLEYGGNATAAGDVNGDGFGDVLFGNGNAGPNGIGESYVVFGKETFPSTIERSALDGTTGFVLTVPVGNGMDTGFGDSVSGAGDLNGDGFDDLIAGAPSSSGAAYVIFGNAGGFAAEKDVTGLNGSEGFKITGSGNPPYFGASVSSAGDVNGDGFDDVIIGAPGNPNSSFTGSSYVLFGKAGGFSSNLNVSSLNGSNGFRITGAAGETSGRSVSGAGDVNGDGFSDLIIGAPYADANGSDSGAGYVVFGHAQGFGSNLSLSTLNGTTGFKLSGEASGDHSGGYVSAAGDINNDGFSDLIIGADHADPNGSNSGASFVVFGKSTAVLSVSDASTLESDTGTKELQFTVSLSAASVVPLSVRYSTVDGAALSGSDFTAVSEELLTFAPGETVKTIVITVFGDGTYEASETFGVSLSSPSSGAKLSATASTATGTILNDDLPPLLSVSDLSILEGGPGTANLVFTVSLSAASELTATVSFGTVDGTALAGSDYTALSGTLAFAAGETEKTIQIEVLGDVTIEAHESFSVLLSAAVNSTITEAQGTASALILNDDTSISVADVTVLEGHSGDTAASFLVTLTAASGLPVSVSFTSADGTATSGVDYTGFPASSLMFAPGETSKVITVDVLGDITVESGLETFLLVLSEPLNAILAKGAGTGTILDDDVTVLGRRKATFVDFDGDLVTITANKGTLKVEDFILFPSGLGSQLALVDLAGKNEFAGAKLSITAKQLGGDGLANVGYIDAAGVDLKAVKVDGDLGRIVVGNDSAIKGAGIGSLSAASIGSQGVATQLPGASASTESLVAGALKKLSLASNVQDAQLIVTGDIGSISIKGGVLGSMLHSDGKIGSVRIAGDLIGSGADAAVLSARGLLDPVSAGKSVAIKKMKIGGSVDHALILAGYDRSGDAVNGDASIGTVFIVHDWALSSIVAGASAGLDGLFGTEDDALIANATPIVSRIASILIKGEVTGTESEADAFGFVAQEIGRFSSGGVKLSLTRGSSNDIPGILVGNTQDTFIRELA